MKKTLELGCALLLVSGAALAEDYVELSGTWASMKDTRSDLTFKGWGGQLRGRYDLTQMPVFLLAGVGTISVDNSGLGVKITEKINTYNLGGGWAWELSDTAETYAQAYYTGGKESLGVPGFSQSRSLDGFTLGVGGHVWFTDMFKGFGKVEYTRDSHGIDGPGLELGGEARVLPNVGVFLAADYSQLSNYLNDRSTTKATAITLGARLTFGGVGGPHTGMPGQPEDKIKVVKPENAPKH